MFSLQITTALLLLSTSQYVGAFKLTAVNPKPFANPSPNIASPNVLEMTRRNGTTRSSKAVQIMRNTLGNFGSAPLIGLFEGQEFSVPVEIETFDLIMDTGSSDTWVVSGNFQCINLFTGLPDDQSECGFGPSLYYFDATTSEIPNENLNVGYGDGEFVSGCVAYDSVTLAGITIPQQEIGVARLAGWTGDNFTSGLLGLSYPGITAVFAGNDPTADNLTDNLIYNPVFTSMYEADLIAPLFSIALNRETEDGPSGYLALGGTPPVAFNPVFASTPIQVFPGEAIVADVSQTLTFYAITPDNFTFSAAPSFKRQAGGPSPPPNTPPTDWPSFQTIVDSGTTLIYLPSVLSDYINSLFYPPAIFDVASGGYAVDCNATAPDVGVVIGGTTFYINQLDLILETGIGTCVSGINSALFSEICILGDVFLKNVVAVFDVGASEMRFAAREYY